MSPLALYLDMPKKGALVLRKMILRLIQAILDWVFSRIYSRSFYLRSYRSDSQPPWGIDKAQSCIQEAFERGLFAGHVLDFGTGLGDNAMFLADQGVKVTALDFSKEALQKAKIRLSHAGPVANQNLSFLQADMLHLRATLADNRFDTLLDSALLHCLSPQHAQQYVASITPHIVSQGKLILFTFSDMNQDPWLGPRRISKAVLQEFFNAKSGWAIDSIESTNYWVRSFGGGFLDRVLIKSDQPKHMYIMIASKLAL